MADTMRFRVHASSGESVIRYHPLTARFVGQPKLEQLYMEKAAKEWSPRSFRIVCVFLLLYFMTISPNLYNLISPDDVVRDKSKTYFLYVFPAMIPIPLMLWLSTMKRFRPHFHNIYAVVVTCWTFSIIGGGMYSMLHEWKVYVQDDVTKLLNYTHFLNASDVFTINHDDDLWPYPTYTGTGRDILFDYMGEVLLPAATMNINLLRMVLVSIFIPLLRIGSVQSAVVRHPYFDLPHLRTSIRTIFVGGHNAFDKRQPLRTPLEHAIADDGRALVKVHGPTVAPRRLVRLVLQVDPNDVPVLCMAQFSGEHVDRA
ncbi:hypothetical protein AaE_013003 [Aphanomyces astaci]|uniref:Uncharacterized protein n=1 Tax=Aphanomyces astaci TaxID=112090 RepID=A0A6A4ZCE6_APHAT|nr:hypothetical protein AaE_013003 [Aphanomyces astaci]